MAQKYNNSVIYIIRPNLECYDVHDVYYGSTTNISYRIHQHKSSYNLYKKNICGGKLCLPPYLGRGV
jgi:predicted GIY-YIG superfamily endonuclease